MLVRTQTLCRLTTLSPAEVARWQQRKLLVAHGDKWAHPQLWKPSETMIAAVLSELHSAMEEFPPVERQLLPATQALRRCWPALNDHYLWIRDGQADVVFSKEVFLRLRDLQPGGAILLLDLRPTFLKVTSGLRRVLARHEHATHDLVRLERSLLSSTSS